jgi:copper chaperone CopZ
MKRKYILEGLDCANCASKMEVAISKLAGVKEVSVNFISQKLTLLADENRMSEIITEAEKIVSRIEPGTRIIPAKR